MKTISDFFSHEEPTIRQAAVLLEQAHKARENDEISQEQFEELVNDILDIKRLSQFCDTLDRKVAVQNAINILRTIIGVLPI